MPRQRPSKRFVQVFCEPCLQVVRANRLTLTEWRVWLYLMACCGVGNWVWCTQRSLARELRLKPANASVALKALLAEGLVTRDRAQDGRTWRYRLPSQYVHYGRLTQVGTPEAEGQLIRLAARAQRESDAGGQA